MRLLQVKELAPNVRPTGGLLDDSLLVDAVKTRISVCLQEAVKAAEVSFGMFSLPVRRVGEPDRRSCVVARRPIVAHVCPQPAGLGPAVTRSQHRDGRVVAVQLAG